jgi:hypothetical protein
MCIEFLKEGNLIVDRGGLDATQLLAIKRGEWTLRQVEKEADHLFKRAESAFDRSKLPTAPNHDKIKELAVEITRFALKERQEI